MARYNVDVPSASPLRISIEETLGERLKDFVAHRRIQGMSWQTIAGDLSDATDGLYRVNRETLRLWFRNEGRGVGTDTAETPCVPPDFLSMGATALATGYSLATIRSLFDRGELEGMRDQWGRRFIDPVSIQELRDSVNLGEAMRISGLSTATLRRRFDDGTLAGFRTSTGNRRIFRSALAELIEEGHAP